MIIYNFVPNTQYYLLLLLLLLARMKESIMEYQAEFLIWKSECEEVGLETNNKALLEDVGQNADLYIANQEGNTQS